jgi:Transcription-repair coupling factor (superfamily II helicase)
MPRRKKIQKHRPNHGYSSFNINVLWWFQLVIVILLCAATYGMWLNHRIQTEFEGKRWSLPARVYARPLELYSGLKLGRDDLIKELQSLGYRQVKNPNKPGEYILRGDHLAIINRGFEFWDGREKSRNVLVNFDGPMVVICAIVEPTSRCRCCAWTPC